MRTGTAQKDRARLDASVTTGGGWQKERRCVCAARLGSTQRSSALTSIAVGVMR